MTVAPARREPPRIDTSAAALVRAILDDFRSSAVRRRLLDGERVIDTPELLAYLSDVDSSEANQVARAQFGTGPDELDAVDRAIEETIRLFGGRPFLWWLGPDDEPRDLSDRLTGRGVVFLDDVPGMAMDLGDLAGADAVPRPSELRIAPVLDATGLRDFHEVVTHGFPEDWTDASATTAIAVGTARVAEETAYRERNGTPTRWLGSVNGHPVATARLHTGAGVAGVYTVITTTDARRRGYGAAITRHALLAARDSGLRIATLQASVAGRRIYERIGFRELCRFRLHEWRASPDQPAGPTGEE